MITEVQKKNYSKITGRTFPIKQEKYITKIQEYAQSIGLSFSFDKNSQKIEYSNNVCYTTQNGGELTFVEFMIHNLCHYILCDPLRRDMADFGLGPSPDTDNIDVDSYTSRFNAEMEERLSIRLSRYFYDYFKIKSNPSLTQEQTYKNYNLDKVLKKLNILNKDFTLTHQIRELSDEPSIYTDDVKSID